MGDAKEAEGKVLRNRCSKISKETKDTKSYKEISDSNGHVGLIKLPVLLLNVYSFCVF